MTLPPPWAACSNASPLFGEEIFPNIQPEPLLVQLEAIPSCPITSYVGEKTDPHLSTSSLQVVVESDKVSPEPPLLQAEQSQFPQPFLIAEVLQPSDHLSGPSLDPLQEFHIFLVLGAPDLDAVLQMGPHKS